jgi:hypothetical protein
MTILAVVAGGLAAPTTAHACSAIPIPEAVWAFGATYPADGAKDVPTDVVLAFEGRPISSTPAVRWGGDLARLMVVRLRELATQQVVQGAAEGWSIGPPPGAVFRPATPLLPETTYEVDARIANTAAPLSEAITGPQVLHFTFTTGRAATGVPTLSGMPRAQQQNYDQPIYGDGCVDFCSGQLICAPSGYERRGQLQVEVPALQGGWAPMGFLIGGVILPGATTVTDAQLQGRMTVLGPYLQVEANRPASFTIGVPDEGQEGPRCLHLGIYDARGLVLRPPPVCFDWRPPQVSAATAPAPAPAGGCNAAPGAPSANLLVVLLASAALAARRR